MKSNKLAFSYVRMSTEKQIKGDSLRRQLEWGQQYAATNNLLLDDGLRDIGVSAWKGNNRKKGALGEFLHMVQSGEIPRGSFLLVESLDRRSRTQVMDALDLFTGILRSGITIVTMGPPEQVYTWEGINGDFGQLIITLTVMARAHEESQRKSERIRAAFANKRALSQRGIRTNSSPPRWITATQVSKGEFTYALNDRAPLIAWIFERSAQGVGFDRIAKELNGRGEPTLKPSTRGWFFTSVSNVVENRSAIGEYQPHEMVDGVRIPRGDPVSDYYPKVVTDDLFLRAQKIRHRNRTGGRGGRYFTNLLDGMAHCAHCRSRMYIVNNSPRDKQYTYLICSANSRKLARDDGVPVCHKGKLRFRYEQAEQFILDNVSEFGVSETLQLRRADADLRQRDEELATLTVKLTDIGRKEARLLEDEQFLPVGRDDVAEVLRRRLLDPDTVKDKEVFRANAVAAVKALATLDPDYANTAALRAQKERAFLDAFPFDPSLMDVFYSKWTSGLPLFQRTRGVLRTFAVALKEAEEWDTSPVAGVSTLLSPPGESGLGTALRDLAGVARNSQTEGEAQAWISILEKELAFAREGQANHPALAHRELEGAVVATFLHSQPPGKKASLADLRSMIGTGKPDGITLGKALGDWASRSWYLDEADLASAPEKADGTKDLPKTWRLGDQPNLKQMHDHARQYRVGEPSVEEKLLDLVKNDPKLKAGAGPGSKFHILPAGAGDVADDGDFHFVVLGPSAAAESGKPSAEAQRYIDQTTGSDKPRVNRNAVVLGVPSSVGVAAARDRIRDYLAWVEVKGQLAGHPQEAIRAASLQAGLKSSDDAMKQAVRQAWCIGVATAEDDTVKAFKVTVGDGKTLFQCIKDDKDSRIQETALDPDLILPGSSYDIWRPEEPTQRVKTLVGAFFERSKLPKMLRRKELLDTVANGAEQGRFVLRLLRPDGSARTWWRKRPDEASLVEANLEAVQLDSAELERIDVGLLRPGNLPGLDFSTGLKVSDLIAYFAGGHIVLVKQNVDGVEYDEPTTIPKCPESAVLEAVTTAVKEGALWLTNGTMSLCAEEPPAGAVTKTAILRIPNSPVPLTALGPEELPDAWTGETATASSLWNAASAKFAPAGVTLPWKSIASTITSALNSHYLEVVPGRAVPWPCEAYSAPAVSFRLPQATGTASDGVAEGQGSGFQPPANPVLDDAVAMAVLDSASLSTLADAIADVQGAVASYGVPISFRVSVEASGLPEAGREALRSELAKAVKAFKLVS